MAGNTYKILHVVDSMARAGTEHQLVLNLIALDRTRFENSLCYLYPVDFLAEEVRRLGIDVFCLGLKGKGQWLSSIYHFVRLIKTKKIDLVHTNLYEADVVGGIAARLSGVPAISTLTNPADATLPFQKQLHVKGYKLWLSSAIQKLVYKTCHRHFIAVSEHVRKSWIGSGIDEKLISVIPRAVSQDLQQRATASVVEEMRRALSLNDNYPVLLNVGRLIPQKGQTYIIEAMPDILERFPKAKLLIAGEGPFRDELKKTVNNLGLDSAVALLGTCRDVKSLYQISDIFVFPSLSEGMPGALLEAAALGKPCIVADIEPTREILEDERSGLFIPQNDSKALAQAVIRLGVNREEARTLGLKAQEKVLSHHIINNIVHKLEDLYIQVLENCGRTK